MTPQLSQQILQKFDEVCQSCGKMDTSQRFMCATCNVENWRQQTVTDCQRYMEGYKAGFKDALVLPEKEEEEIRQRETEMQISAGRESSEPQPSI